MVQLTGPSQVIFADGSAQANLPITVSGATGTIALSVTAIPSQVASVRKTATGTALAVGLTLTTAEAGALVVTRTASGGSFTPIATPVTFSLHAADTGSSGASYNNASVVGVKYRIYLASGSIPAFTTGTSSDVTAVQNQNFQIPGLPTGGAGNYIIEILLDVGTATTLGQFSGTLMGLGYSTATTDQWTGVTAKALASVDGATASALNTLTVSGNDSNPNSLKKLSGAVTGASSGRWVGVRLENVTTTVYPCFFRTLAVQSTSGSGSAPADYTVQIGDSSTNFGSTLAVTGPVITRFGSSDTSDVLGLSVSGGTAPYTISINTQGVTAPVKITKTAGGAAIVGTATALTLAELQALRTERTTHTVNNPGTLIDYTKTVSIRSELSGATTLLGSDQLTAFINRNFFGVGVGNATSSGFVAEMPSAMQVGSISNIPLRYGYGDDLPAGASIQFLTSTDGTTFVVASTIPVPTKGSDGNYTISATISGAASARFWGLRFKFSSTIASSGIGFYSGSATPSLATQGTSYQAPDTITVASSFVISVTDSANGSASGTFKVGAADTVIVESPTSAEPAYIELQEYVSGAWATRGTLSLTGRIADVAPDSGLRFEGTVASVWVTDPASSLPSLGNYDAWGVRFGWGSSSSRKYSYCVGLKPKSSSWSSYPFGDVTQSSRQTVPSQLHRWLVKNPAGTVVETLDWAGSPINDPSKSPKQFWPTDANGNITTPAFRPYHIGQAVCGWTSAPAVRSNAASIWPTVDAALEWTFRDPGKTNPIDYSMTVFQTLGLFNIYAMDAVGVATTQNNWTSQDPEMVTTTDRHISSTMYGYQYRPGQTCGRDVTTGPGGTRDVDRSILGDAFARVLQSPTAVRLHRNVAWSTIALELIKSHMSENCFHVTNPRLPQPASLSAPGAAPSYARSYYVTGNPSDPQSIDLNSGQADSINGANDSPARPGQYALSKTDPSGWLYWSGQIPDAEHNYPFAAIGALLFQSPAHWWAAQFHFLQSSMVCNRTGYLTSFTGSWCLRPNAWPWANAAYLWLLQDSKHPFGVISRANLEAALKAELIKIADVEIPLINADPADVDAVDDYNRALMKRFGGFGSSFVRVAGPTMLAMGYLCQGLEMWKKTGLWDRMRSLDTRCATALDFIIGRIKIATVDLLLDAPWILTAQGDNNYALPSYNPAPWPCVSPNSNTTATSPAGTTPASLPQSWAAWAAANPSNGATFWQNAAGQTMYGIGQYHVLHCVTALRRVFGLSDSRTVSAETTARNLLSSRIAAIRNLPAGQKANSLGDMMVYHNVVSSTETGTSVSF